ncbi:MAG: hypothetical protein CVV13_03700 [Gammaproteobacteria bacterium HGW-Gammaproteobacteria-3]|nr:MAG: hypothetical protein CVV13_03700 [Gammaproteobacteria bacterium HGW-Gammaproteobacteria-3]
MLKASVIISTRNRAALLPRLFNALATMEKVYRDDWELIMVDNGSTDTTRARFDAEIQNNRLPIVAVSAPVPGKSRALNLALKQARGDLVIFTDDDVEPEPLWLASYIEAGLSHPELNGFAGRVLPRWLGPIPAWLHTEGEFALPRGITNTRDFGNEPHILPGDIIPGGVNTALRKTALLQTGGFREDIGPGTSVPFAEDTEYMARYKNQGGLFFYVPKALLYHCNEPVRMTKDYVTHWQYEVARCQVLAFNETADKTLFGVPFYLMRQAIERMMSWTLEAGSKQRLQKKMKLCFILGKIKGHRQRRKFGQKAKTVAD